MCCCHEAPLLDSSSVVKLHGDTGQDLVPATQAWSQAFSGLFCRGRFVWDLSASPLIRRDVQNPTARTGWWFEEVSRGGFKQAGAFLTLQDLL